MASPVPVAAAIDSGDRRWVDALLQHLRTQGFAVGVDHYLRVYALLGQMGAAVPLERLKTLLCPLFADSEDQQTRFYQLFDAFFQPGGQGGAAEAASSPSPHAGHDGTGIAPT